MGIFKKPALKEKTRKREMPEGLWNKCSDCGEVIHNLTLEANLMVCPKCEHHFTIGARERIAMLVDPGTFEEHDAQVTSVDPLEFRGPASYVERLASYKKKTGLVDAVITGVGVIGGHRIGLAVMDFNFIAATMGSVVGEKIARIVEHATKERMPMLIVSASGGARMYEGIFGLMQLAKTNGALARHAEARLPYLSLMTHPTTGGVSASFATVGDVNLAEPKSMVGFAGPRVIKETTHQDLPKGFQTAEFLLERGLIDQIVPRRKLRDTVASLLTYLTPSAP
jgi:acetyl-CoA carboxylase carboxyl transferase subunit beta